MSTHTRLALMGAVLVLALALPAALAIGYYSGRADFFAFLYGSGVGAVGFASISIPVSLLTVRPTGGRMLLGMVAYGGRLLFVAVGVGIPIYLGLWPVLPLLGGVAGVYAVENVLLLIAAPKRIGASPADLPARGGVERRTEA